MSNNKIEKIRNNYINDCDRLVSKIEHLKENLNEAISNNDTRLIEAYQKRLNSYLQRLKNLKTIIEYLREPNYEDILEREQVIKEFPNMVKEVIPNGIPIVFHGNKNIGIVHEIIKSGGLFTPEQRRVDYSSFATLIDVTYKDNIRVSCEFAEQSNGYILPYGAIFVFLPLEREKENVLSTKDNSEVFGGVEGVDFRKEPNRLIGIITTNENKNRIRNWCNKYNLDSQKVFTHEEFIINCKKIFSNNKEEYKIR